MLILIGTVPMAYALNRALPASQLGIFASRSQAASTVIEQKAAGYNVMGNPRPAVTAYVASHTINEGTYPIVGGSGDAISRTRSVSMDRSPRCRPRRSATRVTTCISHRRPFAF